MFKVAALQFLDHELSPRSINSLKSYVKVITSFRCRKKNIEEMQKSLGLLNYIAKVITNLATVLEPLRFNRMRFYASSTPWIISKVSDTTTRKIRHE